MFVGDVLVDFTHESTGDGDCGCGFQTLQSSRLAAPTEVVCAQGVGRQGGCWRLRLVGYLQYGQCSALSRACVGPRLNRVGRKTHWALQGWLVAGRPGTYGAFRRAGTRVAPYRSRPGFGPALCLHPVTSHHQVCNVCGLEMSVFPHPACSICATFRLIYFPIRLALG